jgi:ketol-acid reductoisomerase
LKPNIFFDEDADLSLLDGKIAVIGYGNQGRAQAQNVRDSGLEVIIGSIRDGFWDIAESDGFTVMDIPEAVEKARFVLLLVPDELQPQVYEQSIKSHLSQDKVICFASGYSITFDLIEPSEEVDTILVAPRMIGAGVRDSYKEGKGFHSFIAVENDSSGHAREIALAIAKAIGSTKPGGSIIEVTFRQETELDLFNEQCFGAAFGHVLMTAVDVAIEAGYPPEAVLVDIYMSGEYSYNMLQMAKVGVLEQTRLHSRCSQYGSMSRALRYVNPELREQMLETLKEIQDGSFANEFQQEWDRNLETLDQLREMMEETPIVILDKAVRRKLKVSES